MVPLTNQMSGIDICKSLSDVLGIISDIHIMDPPLLISVSHKTLIFLKFLNVICNFIKASLF